MIITFEIADMYSHRMDMMYAGKAPALRRRIVSIELTPEQISQIGLKMIGHDCGKDQYEEIMDLFVGELK